MSAIKTMWSNHMIFRFLEEMKSRHVSAFPTHNKLYPWKELSRVLKIPVPDLRDKWYSLRTSYRRERQRELGYADAGLNYKPKWFAYKAMSFLKDLYKSSCVTGSMVTRKQAKRRILFSSDLEHESCDSPETSETSYSKSPHKKSKRPRQFGSVILVDHSKPHEMNVLSSNLAPNNHHDFVQVDSSTYSEPDNPNTGYSNTPIAIPTEVEVVSGTKNPKFQGIKTRGLKPPSAVTKIPDSAHSSWSKDNDYSFKFKSTKPQNELLDTNISSNGIETAQTQGTVELGAKSQIQTQTTNDPPTYSFAYSTVTIATPSEEKRVLNHINSKSRRKKHKFQNLAVPTATSDPKHPGEVVHISNKSPSSAFSNSRDLDLAQEKETSDTSTQSNDSRSKKHKHTRKSDSDANNENEVNSKQHKETPSRKEVPVSTYKAKKGKKATTSTATGDNATADAKLRRSTRDRIPPLETWRGQRRVYNYVDGEMIIIGIEEGLKIDNAAERGIRRRMEAYKKAKSMRYKKQKLLQEFRKLLQPIKKTYLRNSNNRSS